MRRAARGGAAAGADLRLGADPRLPRLREARGAPPQDAGAGHLPGDGDAGARWRPSCCRARCYSEAKLLPRRTATIIAALVNPERANVLNPDPPNPMRPRERGGPADEGGRRGGDAPGEPGGDHQEDLNLLDRWEATRPPLLRLKDTVMRLLSGPPDEDAKMDAMVGTLEKKLIGEHRGRQGDHRRGLGRPAAGLRAGGGRAAELPRGEQEGGAGQHQRRHHHPRGAREARPSERCKECLRRVRADLHRTS